MASFKKRFFLKKKKRLVLIFVFCFFLLGLVVSLPKIFKKESKFVAKGTSSVSIYAAIIEPNPLTIEKNIQVEFINKTDRTISVIGDGWGNIPLMPGKIMVKAFLSKGTYPYTVSGTDKPLEGKVIVK